MASRIIHGHKSGGFESPTHMAWRAMKRRCSNKNCNSYPNYGGRGIKVCERWNSFVNFLEDMGEVPTGLTLDRYPDNNGNYEPSNCRWATRNQQVRNTRLSQLISYKGQTKSVWDWAEEVGIKAKTIKKRLASGWSVEKSFETPTLTIHQVSALGSLKQWGFPLKSAVVP